MMTTHRPVRTTILIGAIGALAGVVADGLVGGPGAGPLITFAITWFMIARYAWALVRWSGGGILGVVFPLLVLGGLGVAMPRSAMTLGLALVIFSWIRSGICFPRSPFASLGREVLLCGGGGLMVALGGTSTTLAWGLGIWLFSLVQALFFIFFESATVSSTPPDPFDLALRRVEEILEGYPMDDEPHGRLRRSDKRGLPEWDDGRTL